MYRFDDRQHWHYPHHHPNTVISPIGRGPAGPKGDALTYEDMTEAERNDLASRVGRVDVVANYQVFERVLEDASADPSKAINSLDPGFGAPLTGSIYIMEVNGLTVPDDEFTVGQNGVLSFDLISGGPYEDKIVVRRIDFVTEQPETPVEPLDAGQE